MFTGVWVRARGKESFEACEHMVVLEKDCVEVSQNPVDVEDEEEGEEY